jgi:hypothetical protein
MNSVGTWGMFKQGECKIRFKFLDELHVPHGSTNTPFLSYSTDRMHCQEVLRISCMRVSTCLDVTHYGLPNTFQVPGILQIRPKGLHVVDRNRIQVRWTCGPWSESYSTCPSIIIMLISRTTRLQCAGTLSCVNNIHSTTTSGTLSNRSSKPKYRNYR